MPRVRRPSSAPPADARLAERCPNWTALIAEPLPPTLPGAVVLEAGRLERQYWRDLWRYRELLAFLAWRDVSVRYKQTVIGVAWAVLRPVLTAVVLVVIFGRLAGLPSPAGVPYPLLALCGMLGWQLLSTAAWGAGESLITNSNLVSKVYFPRLLVPIGATGLSVMDFLVTLPVVAAAMLWYGHAPTWRLVFLPAFLLLGVAVALGVGVWLAAVSVRFRDVRHLIPFGVQFGLYLSPVGFSYAAVAERSPDYGWIMALNPATGVIEGLRWSLLGPTGGLTPVALAASLGFTALALSSGIRRFRRAERTFADVI